MPPAHLTTRRPGRAPVADRLAARAVRSTASDAGPSLPAAPPGPRLRVPLPSGWRAWRSIGVTLALVLGAVVGLAGPAHAAGPLPCDSYGAAGTPCVAAHSTVRALFAAYDGPLYQLTRASDGATHNVGVLTAGGYADAADHDAFCNGTTCSITRIYDQTGRRCTRSRAATRSPAR